MGSFPRPNVSLIKYSLDILAHVQNTAQVDLGAHFGGGCIVGVDRLDQIVSSARGKYIHSSCTTSTPCFGGFSMGRNDRAYPPVFVTLGERLRVGKCLLHYQIKLHIVITTIKPRERNYTI